ncbi:hypothetical protein BDZ45DRAFT_765421 [Acephala macrosclerotiorum]|nr:hypothetical protein BDZ45DRAFT_765421 [Acephala macrosclerotiorum]
MSSPLPPLPFGARTPTEEVLVSKPQASSTSVTIELSNIPLRPKEPPNRISDDPTPLASPSATGFSTRYRLDCAGLEYMIEGQGDEINRLMDTEDELREKIAELTRENSSLKSEVDSLTKDNANLKNKVATLKANQTNQNENAKDKELLKMTKRLEGQNAQISNLKKDIEKKKKGAADLITAQANAAAKAKSDQDRSTEQVDKVKTELTRKKNAHKGTREEFGRIARHLGETEKELGEHKVRLGAAEWRLQRYKIVGEKGGLTRSRHLIPNYDPVVNTAGIIAVHGGIMELDMILYLLGHISMANRSWFENAYLVPIDFLHDPNNLELLKVSPKLLRMRNFHASIHLDLRKRTEPGYEPLRRDLERFSVLLEECRSVEARLNGLYSTKTEVYAALEAIQENDGWLDELGSIVAKVQSERPFGRRLDRAG